MDGQVEAIQGFLCSDLWTSMINGANDGVITIDTGPNPTTGAFSGLHYLPNHETRQISGTCTHPGVGNPNHFIEFIETSTAGITYRYSGIVIPDPTAAHTHRTQGGKRHRMAFDFEVGARLLLDDDDWVGTHST